MMRLIWEEGKREMGLAAVSGFGFSAGFQRFLGSEQSIRIWTEAGGL